MRHPTALEHAGGPQCWLFRTRSMQNRLTEICQRSDAPRTEWQNPADKHMDLRNRDIAYTHRINALYLERLGHENTSLA